MKTTYPYIKFYLKRTVDDSKYAWTRETIGVYSTEQEDEVSANIEKDPLFYRWVDPDNHGLTIETK